MCILCVIQKWSRRVATMLPWLVIPLIGLWALSQLLPPAFRFEITSPRLACVFVLLVTLFWYEVLMPQLSAWRVRRNAWLRERKRTEAVELQKLRKTATRRCRNCLNPYRDQNPGGGRFMCSYCGHVSRRPVLELPVGPGPGNGPGLVRELVGKGSSWMCWGGSGGWAFRGDEDCLGDKSCCGAVFFACKVMAKVLERVRWLLGKLFIMVGLGRWECEGDDGEGRGVLGRGGENGVGTNESRGEKARRKAEEKRQARLERELFEEEERKQREEVAKMVEERRKKMRDERMEGQADKDHGKPVGLKAERKRQERRREKDRERDKGSSKSNSDVEEVEKRNGKDSEKKREFDKRSEIIRKEHQKQVDNVHSKSVVTNYNRTSAGNRYFDRVRGSIFSSSKAFGFGRGATNVSANAAKDNKFNSSVDHVYTASTRRDVGHTAAKSNTNGHERNTNHSVLPEPQPWTAPKKSWQQLFTRSSSVPQSSNSNVICRPNSKHQAEANSPQLSGQSSVTQSFDNPIHFGLPSPFNVTTYPNGSSSSSSLGFSRPTEPLFSTVGDAHDFRHEEQDIFEDPCYVPDPVSLLGPVSESIDDFQSDLGSSFVMDKDVDKPHSLKNSTSASEANNCRRLPIKSPLSRENYCQYPSTSKHQDVHAFHSDDATANAKGTWQMWNSAPLGQEGLGLIGDLRNWLLPSQRNIPNEDGFVLPPSQKPMASHFKRDDSIVSSTRSPKNAFLPSGQSSGTFGPVAGSSGYDPWLQTALFPHLSGGLKAHEGPTQNEMRYGSLNGSASNHVDDGSHANGWSKKEWPLHGSVETIENPSIATRTHIRAQQPPQDVQYSHFGDFYSKTG